MVAPLPVAEPDVVARHHAVQATTHHLKTQSHQVESAAWLEELADESGRLRRGPAGVT